MQQLALFSAESPADRVVGAAQVARADHTLLATFQAARLAEGAHVRSAQREVSQLRALLREARLMVPDASLTLLLSDQDLLAHVLCEPSDVMSRATGRTRLLAAQRCIQTLGPTLGRDPDSDLAGLDERLPTQRSQGWHTTGAIVAGVSGRRRRRGPTLHAADLFRLVESAGTSAGPNTSRDRALVALHCFSGLRPEEIVHLGWEDLEPELSVDGASSLTLIVKRSGRAVRLQLPPPAVAEVNSLAAQLGTPWHMVSGPVFLTRGSAPRTLSYRASRDIPEPPAAGPACRQ